jgi:competence protein ComEC
MLPSLTVAFIIGLLVGSQFPYFPLVTSFLLFLIGLGAVALEQFNRVSVPKVTWHYGILLVGVLYWLLAVNLTAHAPIAEDPSNATIEVTGRIVAPVQQAPDRLVMIIRSDNPVASAPSRRVRLTWRTPFER